MTTTQIIKGTPAAVAMWKRGCEPRYAIQYDASCSWGDYDVEADGTFYAGMLATLINGDEVVKADSTVSGGRFRGVLFTEASPVIDDTQAPAPPTIAASLGNGLILIRNVGLADGADYTANNGFVKAGTTTNAGKIVPYGGAPGAGAIDLVGRVQKVYVDGVLLHLFAATI